MNPFVYIVPPLALAAYTLRMKHKPVSVEYDPLSAVLLQWTPDDPFTVRDLLNGGVFVLGRSGSGKTSTTGKELGIAIACYPNSGGLIIGVKPEDPDMWRDIFQRAGRINDLLVFDAEGPWRLNFLDYLAQLGADARTITKYTMMLGESLQAADNRGGGDDGPFFGIQNERWIYDGVVVLKLARGRVSTTELYQFITTAATSPEQLDDEKWQQGFHNQCLKAAFYAAKTDVEEWDYQLAVSDWLRHWPEMADRTRTSIAAGIMGILHVSNTGVVRKLTTGETNCSPLDMFKGKFVLVNMPRVSTGPAGTFISAGWRLLTQFSVLWREAKPDDFINVIFCDEFQETVNGFDAEYLAQCRSHMGCMVCMTQSTHALYASIKNDPHNNRANALLANFQHKVMHALGDVETATYASSLVGKSLQTFFGGSMSPDEDIASTLMGQSQFTGNFSQHFESILQPNFFMNGLRTGGRANGCICDAVVIRSGEPFAGGANWIKVSFKQR